MAALLLASAVPAAQATFPGSNGKLVYYTSWVGPHTFFTPPDIYTVDPDGSNGTRLTTDERSSSPVWSPDGKRIAFSSSRDQADYRSSIYTMNADGTDVRRLTNSPPRTDYQPKWSPDGKKIAFIATRVESEPDSCEPGVCNFEIYAVNTDGSGETRLTNSAGVDRNPSWSPDGNRLVFESNRDGNYEIYAVNADGTGTIRLTNDPRNDGDPEWSPLGDEIAFDRATPVPPYSDGFQVNVMRPDGSGVSELPLPRGFRRNEPTWSPDGRWIAFVAFAGEDQIHVARPDGSDHLALTNDQAPVPDYPGFISNRSPTFSPDGTKVAFTHVECPFYCDYAQLQTVNADGSGGRTNVSGNAVQKPDWQPIVGPQRGDYKNAAHFCKALREFLGDEAFRIRYGGGANAHGKCVSGDGR